ncbi:hypothetical protein CP532_0300 [Ophiocordyceps camponoti-leonardi (nom. inval.)]|nr:hypothetical protein CP532_0300 [Ophiocordyceps camponoti-leonardi (nom. inval.)]
MNELLLTPSDSAFTVPQTAYVCTENWDGGSFCEYPQRKGRCSLVPPELRRGLIEEPYLELLHPTPGNQLQPFVQTWLFFGLTAEALCLNEADDGSARLIDEATASSEIAELHSRLCRHHDGVRHLSGAAWLDLMPLIRQRLSSAPHAEQRLNRLGHYLRHSLLFLHSIRANLDRDLRFSIAAVGELLSTLHHAVTTAGGFTLNLMSLGFNWQFQYLEHGGSLESEMLDRGWCPSEVNKIRSQFTSLCGIHYASHLKKMTPRMDHERCSAKICRAFQIDMSTYRPLHVQGVCEGDCWTVDIDVVSVQSILRSTNSFPIIRLLWPDEERDELKLIIEPFQPGTSFVALSHVWADGLGNPQANSLPQCQMQRMASKIAALPDQSQGLFWVDTLCCPVEPETKAIALQRIADVYRHARHVLVLDSSLSAVNAEDTHPAELLFQGALARSLQIQFADRAVGLMELLAKLSVAKGHDMRYERLWIDIANQRALHSRSVSVPSDEPLCIATLLGLEASDIATFEGQDRRMALVWDLVAREGGGLPSGFIFNIDEPLDVPGWRWAPRSLLGAFTDDSVLGIDERIVRFEVKSPAMLGTPTAEGLRVTLPGCRLLPRSRLHHLPLHPWPGLISPAEDQVLVRDETSGRWFRIVDWYFSRKVGSWTEAERTAYHRQQDNPLCRAIDAGDCGLVWTAASTDDSPRMCCMVRFLNNRRGNDGIARVRRERTVILAALGKTETRVMDRMQLLADEMANNCQVQELIESGELQLVQEKMKHKLATTWESEPWLQAALRETLGDDLEEETVWAMVPKLFSHHIEMVPLGEKVWAVD